MTYQNVRIKNSTRTCICKTWCLREWKYLMEIGEWSRETELYNLLTCIECLLCAEYFKPFPFPCHILFNGYHHPEGRWPLHLFYQWLRTCHTGSWCQVQALAREPWYLTTDLHLWVRWWIENLRYLKIKDFFSFPLKWKVRK